LIGKMTLGRPFEVRLGKADLLWTLGVMRLIKLHVHAAGQLEERHQAVAVIFDRGSELDPFGFQVGNRFLDLVAEERDRMRARTRVRLAIVRGTPRSADGASKISQPSPTSV
jgi:hypothetical protein